MNEQNCPSRDQLVGYVQGTISEKKAEVVAEHLETCVPCENTVEQIESQGDALLSNLRRPPPPRSEIESPECQEALAHAEAILGPEPAATDASAPTGDEPLKKGVPLGEYHLLEKLGQGGMGAVYKARHTKLKRIVAIKVLPKDKIPDQRAVARFEREMEAVGQLDHPNIVRAHDAREIDGVHFLVMEYVKGQDLSAVVRRGPLAIADACDVIRQAALGLQYAHEHGLVHRDIKPSNLMLTAEGRIKILDLGLALLSSPETGKEELTTEGQPMGTADYMAPEQTTDSHSVDIRADIYSLGCTLYKLLTGRSPFHGEKYKTVVQKMMAHLVEEAPRVETLRREVPRALAAIVHRMMAKKPGDRFATPGQAAAALDKFAASSNLRLLHDGADESQGSQVDQTGTLPHVSSASGDTGDHSEPAAQPSASSATWMSLPRRYVPWIAAAVAAALLGGGIWAAGVIIRVKDEQGRVVAEITAPEGATVEVTPNRKPSSKTVQEPRSAASSAATPQPGPWVAGPDGEALPGIVPRPAKIPGIYRWQVDTKDMRAANPGHILASPDGRFLAIQQDYRPSHGIRILDAQTFQTVRILLGHSGLFHMDWSPVGGFLASVGREDKTVWIWKPDGTQTRTITLPVSPDACPSGIWLAPDGQKLVVNRGDGHSQIVGVDGKLGAVLQDARKCAWSPDSRRVAATRADGRVRIWSPEGTAGSTLDAHLELRLVNRQGGGDQFVWSPDGQVLACAGSDGKVRLWKADGSAGPVMESRAGAVECLAWRPNGQWLASYGVDSRVRLWKPDGTPGPVLEASPGPAYNIRSLAWSPDGRYLACALSDGAKDPVRAWQVDPQPTEVLHLTLWGVSSIAWSPDSQRLWLRRFAAGISAVFVTGAESFAAPRSTGPIRSVAWSRDGRQIATGDWRGTARIWSAEGVLLGTLRGTASWAQSIAWHPQNQGLAIAIDREIRIWTPGDAAPAKNPRLRGHEGDIFSLAWRPDGALLASGSDDRTIRLWKPDGSVEKVLTGHAARVCSVAWSPTGNRLLSLSSDGEARLWTPDGTLERAFQAKGGMGDFSPDGQRIVVDTAGESRGIASWTLEGKLERAWKTPGDGGVPAWRPNGSVIALPGNNCPFWNTEGRPLPPLDKVAWGFLALAWSPDGRWLATGRGDGLVHCWDFDPREQKWVAIPFEDGTSVSLSPAGQIFCGDPAVCEKQLVYVVQRTPAGPQELWSYKQFDEFVKKAGMGLRAAKPRAKARSPFVLEVGQKRYALADSLDVPSPRAITIEAYLTPAREGLYPHRAMNVMDAAIWQISGQTSGGKQQGNRWRFTAAKPSALGGGVSCVSPIPCEIGSATHVAGVWDGKEMRLYVNGIFQGKSMRLDRLPMTTKGLELGGPSGNWFDGQIREVRVSTVARYDRDFTPADRFDPDEHTLVLYHCDEGQGEVLHDSSGHGHDAKIVGAKWVNWDQSTKGPASATNKDAASPPAAPPIPSSPQPPAPTAAVAPPLTSRAFVQKPAKLPGIKSWTIDARRPRVNLRTIHFADQGRQVVGSCPDGVIRWWDVASGKLVRALPSHGRIEGATYRISPDGARLAVGGILRESPLRIHDVQTGRLLRTLMTGHSISLAWSPNGAQLAVLWDRPPEHVVTLFDSQSGDVAVAKTFPASNAIRLAWSPENLLYLTSRDSSDVSALAPETLEVVKTIKVPGGLNMPYHRFRVSPDGKFLASSPSGSERVEQVVEMSTGRILYRDSGDVREADCHAWSPDGKWFADTARVRGESCLRIFSTKDWQTTRSFPNRWDAMVWGMDNDTIAGSHGEISIVRRSTGATKVLADCMLKDLGLGGGSRSALWSPDGRRVVVYQSRGVVVDVSAARIIKTFPDRNSPVFAWSADGKQLKSGNKGRLREAWDAETGEPIGKIDEPASAPGGEFNALTQLTQAASSDLIVWNPETKAFRVSFVPLENSQWAAISPDGHYRVAEGLDDELIYIAEADNGEMLVYSPKEFAERFGWKNDPNRVGVGKTAASPAAAPQPSLWTPGPQREALFADHVAARPHRASGEFESYGSDVP